MDAPKQKDTILIVDDEQPFRVMVRITLQEEGYSTLEAGDGLEAQEIIQKRPDELTAVLLDWSMPLMTGIELLQWMKSQPRVAKIPVIMQTAMDQPRYIRQGIDAGAFYYLTKPVQRELLRSIVQAAVSDYHYKQHLLRKLRESEKQFILLEEGTFKFRTLQEAEALAVRIANASSDPEQAMVIAELLTNAVEHGNLGVSYEEKTKLVDEGTWIAEIGRRLVLPENSHKYVSVKVKRNDGDLLVEIEDQGSGFDFQQYVRFNENRVFDNHGRGIAIASTSLHVQYLGSGNKVLVSIPTQKDNRDTS